MPEVLTHLLQPGELRGHEIKLTRGYTAWVSEIDYERINKFNWFASVGKYQIRAARMEYRQMIYMPYEVLLVTPIMLGGKEIDHIDRNPLNNMRENLRVVSHTENMRNTLRHKQRKGYCFNKRANLWYVYLDMPGKSRINLGYTKTEAEAIARVEEARKCQKF